MKTRKQFIPTKFVIIIKHMQLTSSMATDYFNLKIQYYSNSNNKIAELNKISRIKASTVQDTTTVNCGFENNIIYVHGLRRSFPPRFIDYIIYKPRCIYLFIDKYTWVRSIDPILLKPWFVVNIY